MEQRLLRLQPQIDSGQVDHVVSPYRGCVPLDFGQSGNGGIEVSGWDPQMIASKSDSSKRLSGDGLHTLLSHVGSEVCACRHGSAPGLSDTVSALLVHRVRFVHFAPPPAKSNPTSNCSYARHNSRRAGLGPAGFFQQGEDELILGGVGHGLVSGRSVEGGGAGCLNRVEDKW